MSPLKRRRKRRQKRMPNEDANGRKKCQKKMPDAKKHLNRTSQPMGGWNSHKNLLFWNIQCNTFMMKTLIVKFECF